MTLLISYIKDHLSWVLVWAFSLLFLLFLFVLYRLHLEIYIFFFLIVFLLAIVFLGCDFLQYRRIHKILSKYNADTVHLALDEKVRNLYQKDLFRLLQIQNEKLEAVANDKDRFIQENTDFYTMWIHQVKLPIAAMNLLLEEEEVDRPSYKTQLLRLDQYTDMVLAAIRMHSKQSDFLFSWVSLDSMIRTSIRYFSTQFIINNIRLEYETVDLKIITDEKWFVFVLEQVLSNSLKYTNKNGVIQIYLEQDWLVIEDNGIGIDQSDLARVFEKGFTGYNGRSYLKATGMGLYLCKEILSKLSSSIRIESKLGQYTKVYIFCKKG